MNVEIGAEAALFPEKEYIKEIFVAVYRARTLPYRPFSLLSGRNYSQPIYDLLLYSNHPCSLFPRPEKEFLNMLFTVSSTGGFSRKILTTKSAKQENSSLFMNIIFSD
jgi:hypothetical protein